MTHRVTQQEDEEEETQQQEGEKGHAPLPWTASAPRKDPLSTGLLSEVGPEDGPQGGPQGWPQGGPQAGPEDGPEPGTGSAGGLGLVRIP